MVPTAGAHDTRPGTYLDLLNDRIHACRTAREHDTEVRPKFPPSAKTAPAAGVPDFRRTTTRHHRVPSIRTFISVPQPGVQQKPDWHIIYPGSRKQPGQSIDAVPMARTCSSRRTIIPLPSPPSSSPLANLPKRRTVTISRESLSEIKPASQLLCTDRSINNVDRKTGLFWHGPPYYTPLVSFPRSSSHLVLLLLPLLLPLFLPPRSAPAALDRSVTQTQTDHTVVP
jgi:hypothetical protein